MSTFTPQKDRSPVKLEIEPQPTTDQIALVSVLRALSETVRLQIVLILATDGEQTCGPLAERLGLPQSTLSHHLRQLRESGVTQSQRDGTLRRMSVRSADLAERFPGLLNAVLAAASQ